MKSVLLVFLFTAVILFAEETNQYNAPLTSVAPVIDGIADPVWEAASWDSIPYTWLGEPPTNSDDFSGRYKVLWDQNFLYLLVEIVDDELSDDHEDPLDNYWNDDCFEILLDENRSGGDHHTNYSAFAYHISTKFDVVDIGEDGQPHLFNDHLQVTMTKSGDKYLWEMKVKVYGEDYAFEGPNTPLTLSQGKTLGFSLAYCDNDATDSRDNFMGSVDTPGHYQNLGYQDASVFGTLVLDPPSTRILQAPHKQNTQTITKSLVNVQGQSISSSLQVNHSALFPR